MVTPNYELASVTSKLIRIFHGLDHCQAASCIGYNKQ
jgi:hypothetical protein